MDSAQGDALGAILDVDGVGEACRVVEGTDHQAAGAGAIRFELHTVEQQTIGDTATGENDVLS